MIADRIIPFELPRIAISRTYLIGALAVVGYVFAYALSKGGFGEGYGGFPSSFELSIAKPIDSVIVWTGDNLSWLFDPLSAAVDAILSKFEALLLWAPWIVLLTATGLLGFRISGWPMATLCGGSLLFIGVLGLWDSAMITLSIMGVSVILAVAIGVPLGIIGALSDRFEAFMRPVLDTMQVLPAFVYLMPALFLFGVSGSVSVFLTVVYAVPPAIRLTNLGIRQVPKLTIETAHGHGSSTLQTLFRVQLPLAKPSIMMGINQTIMMALAMVIITALVGSDGLGRDVWTALRRIDSGSGLEAGLAIVLLAIILDRLSYALARQNQSGQTAREGLVSRMPTTIGQPRSGIFLTSRQKLVGAGAVIILLFLVGSLVSNFAEFPEALRLSMSDPVNSAVDWAAVHLHFITSWVRDDVIREFGLAPIQTLLRWLPWSATVIGVTGLAFVIGGKKTAIITAASFLFFGFGGVWDLTMHTLSQVLVAVVLSVVLGVIIGVWASQSDAVDSALRPILDTMQTMPAFVYLIPVIMLWSSGPVAGIIATVIYAIPPAIRMTSMGIRMVPREVVETGVSHGSTGIQTLLRVKIPLAMPTVMMGVNQTIIMALAMVIIGGLVGGGGLGQEVFVSAVYLEMGRGFVAGMAIVLMAMVLDRMSQGNKPRLQRSEVAR